MKNTYVVYNQSKHRFLADDERSMTEHLSEAASFNDKDLARDIGLREWPSSRVAVFKVE